MTSHFVKVVCHQRSTLTAQYSTVLSDRPDRGIWRERGGGDVLYTRELGISNSQYNTFLSSPREREGGGERERERDRERQRD